MALFRKDKVALLFDETYRSKDSCSFIAISGATGSKISSGTLEALSTRIYKGIAMDLVEEVEVELWSLEWEVEVRML